MDGYGLVMTSARICDTHNECSLICDEMSRTLKGKSEVSTLPKAIFDGKREPRRSRERNLGLNMSQVQQLNVFVNFF
jgi:hypothetical protein